MKRGFVLLICLAVLTGCASTLDAGDPALTGKPRVPVNKTIPDAVPYTVPAATTTTTGD